MTEETYDIHKAAGIIIKDRHFLVTRSAGKDIFIAPGGKLEPGETVVEALAREMTEEVNITIDTSTLEVLGTFFAQAAAGHRNRSIQMDTFIIHEYEGELSASSEVEELSWVNTQTTGIELGSIMEHDIMPLLKQRGLID